MKEFCIVLSKVIRKFVLLQLLRMKLWKECSCFTNLVMWFLIPVTQNM